MTTGKRCPADSQPENATPGRVRDIVVQCFFHAQKETLRRANRTDGWNHGEEELRRSVEDLIRTAFRETGGDFERPTRQQLCTVVDRIASKAAVWGTPREIIDRHKAKIGRALAALA